MPSPSGAASEPAIYVLRVYRQAGAQVRGVLEDPRTGTRRPFATAGELWQLIAAGESEPPAGPADEAPSRTSHKETKP